MGTQAQTAADRMPGLVVQVHSGGLKQHHSSVSPESIATSIQGPYMASFAVDSFESSNSQGGQQARVDDSTCDSVRKKYPNLHIHPSAEQQSHKTLQSPLIQSLVSPTLDRNGQNESPRPALFDDHVAPSYVPGSLHLAPDSTIERLAEKLGVVPLIRQLASDLAHRERELVTFRFKAEERERALKKMLVEVEVSNADIEKRLASCHKQFDASHDDGGTFMESINEMMQQALDEDDAFSVTDSRSLSTYSDDNEDYDNLITPKATLRVRGNAVGTDSASVHSISSQKSSGLRGWKDYFWGQKAGVNDTTTVASSNLKGAQVRETSVGSTKSNRKVLQQDLFTPPPQNDTAPTSRSASRSSAVSVRSPREEVPNPPSSARPEKRMPSSLVFHRSSTSGHSINPANFKAVAMAAESISTSPPPVSLIQRDRSNRLASLTLKLVADARSGRNHPSTPTTPSHTRNRQPGRTGSELNVPYDQRVINARDDLQRIIARNTATARQRTASISSTASGKVVNNGHNWLPSALKDRATGPVSTGNPGQTSTAPDASLGPVEMDTIVPHAVQPPTLLQSWEEHYPADYLTDRFGFIYDKRQRSNSIASSNTQKENQAEDRDGNSSQSGISLPLSPVEPNTENGHSEESKQQGRSSSETKSVSQGESSKVASSFMGRITRSGASVIVPPSAPKISEVPLALRTKSGALTAEESTVRLLLGQLSDMHDSLQRDRSIKWNEFLKRVRAERRKGDGEEKRMPETLMADGELIGVSTLGNSGKGGKQKWKEFRKLVLGGIPVSYRWKVWTECSGASTLKVPGYYEELLQVGNDDPLIMSQISMDINRTLTDNIFFRKGPGVHKLKQVLIAYSRRNPAVGYCQGMNMIAASLLLIMPTEEDAFWVLVSIIENILPKTYFEQSLLASRADQTVLKLYVKEILPNLDAHLQRLGVELEALTFQWFLSIFTNCLAAEALYRVWDVLLCIEGSTFLFQTALALLRLNESALLECNTAAAVYSYLNSNMTHQGISIDGLIQASEALRIHVKREDVEARRDLAIQTELELNSRDEVRSHRTSDSDSKRKERNGKQRAESSSSKRNSPGRIDSNSNSSGESGSAPLEPEGGSGSKSRENIDEEIRTLTPSPPWAPWM